jgi:hypothetical protein
MVAFLNRSVVPFGFRRNTSEPKPPSPSRNCGKFKLEVCGEELGEAALRTVSMTDRA